MFDKKKNDKENIEKKQQNSLNTDVKDTSGENGEKPKKSVGKEVLEWVQALAIAAVVAFFLQTFLLMVVRVDGESMMSTLSNNDRMIVWKLWDDPEQGDIVVVKSAQTKNNYWIKRVIATEGEHVRIDYDENAVYVDGVKLDEPYINQCHCSICAGDPMIKNGGTYTDLVVPKGCVFVMGDNRNHSADSRIEGPFNVDAVKGEAILRFWPLSEISVY